MNLLKILVPILAFTTLWIGASLPLQAEDSKLDFKEVFELLKSQIKETPVEDMEDAAARGLIQSLSPRVRLGNSPDPLLEPDWPTNALHSQVLEKDFGYLHIAQFAPGIAPAALQAIRSLLEDHSLQGLILDLRFSHGTHYAAVPRLADPFFSSEEPLLNYGEGLQSSSPKTNAIQLPLVVLINRQSSGASEALAAILRQGGIALLIGGQTAGEATKYREFKLARGPSLWIATEPVSLGNNNPLPLSGVEPDISLTVEAADERQWLKDPYADLAAAKLAANTSEASSGDPASTPRRRLNEAELVRMLRDGYPAEPDPTFNLDPLPEIKTPALIKDPALARALDFLKGLAVVRKFKAN
jgi:hypothetical protein